MPAVWYSKSEEEEAEGADGEPMERARILRGERVITKPFVEVSSHDAVSELTASKLPMAIQDVDIDTALDEDSDSELSDYQMASQTKEDHMVLVSCGLLMVSGMRVLETLSEGLTTPGWGLADDEREVTKEDLAILLGKYREILHTNDLSDMTMKHRSMSVDVSDEKEMQRTWKCSPAREIVRENRIQLIEGINMRAGRSNEILLTSQLSEENVGTNLLKETCDAEEIDVFAAVSATHQTSPGEEQLAEEHESWISINIAKHTETQSQVEVREAKKQLHHSCMKMSFSEGSLAATYHTDVEEMTVDLDEFEMDDYPRVSALSRLKGKMMTSMPSPQGRSHHQERIARHNRMKSQLRFQECQTKILLL